MIKKVMKALASAGGFIAALITRVKKISASELDWITGGDESGGSLSGLVETAKGLGQDAYTLMMIIGGAGLIICMIILALGLIFGKGPAKREENKSWALYVVLGGVVLSGVTTIAGLIMSIGAGIGSAG